MIQKVGTILYVDAVTEHEIHLFSTMLEVNRGSTASASITCSWVSETNPTTNRNTGASGYGHVSHTKRKSNQEKSEYYMYDQWSIPTTHRISGASASFRLRLSILPPYLTGTTLNAPSQETLVALKRHFSRTSSGICLHYSLRSYHNLQFCRMFRIIPFANNTLQSARNACQVFRHA